MSARFLVGDVFERMAELPDGSVDLVMTSPPFLALRSYLPADHPDKGKEIGSEATPAEFIDTLLALTAEWRRLLAPHGSICVELGDTYAGSGGAGGDYNPGGLRDGQQKWDRPGKRYPGNGAPYANTFKGGGPGGAGWPMEKSLCGIPTLYSWSLAYGRNLLTSEPSPAGMWRVRNVKPWIRSNPPVSALGDKERPATSYITVATIARDRYFDLDGVRSGRYEPRSGIGKTDSYELEQAKVGPSSGAPGRDNNPAGSPPLDWWHHVDAVLDAELQARAGKPVSPGSGDNNTKGADERSFRFQVQVNEAGRVGAQGVHLRRALERAGILTTVDALDVSPKGYSGAHYAVWPPELVRLLVQEMCPPRVCTTCGEPSRRLVDRQTQNMGNYHPCRDGGATTAGTKRTTYKATHLGWSDCGHGTWRPGLVLDPFAGSGTTLAVASGMGRDSIGIDIDERNADLARERLGMFLEVAAPTTEGVA